MTGDPRDTHPGPGSPSRCEVCGLEAGGDGRDRKSLPGSLRGGRHTFRPGTQGPVRVVPRTPSPAHVCARLAGVSGAACPPGQACPRGRCEAESLMAPLGTDARRLPRGTPSPTVSAASPGTGLNGEGLAPGGARRQLSFPLGLRP